MKKLLYLIQFLWLFLLVSTPAIDAQVLGLELLNGKPKVNIKFNYEQGFILLDVRFNNSLPLTFILDTGADTAA